MLIGNILYCVGDASRPPTFFYNNNGFVERTVVFFAQVG